VSQAVEPSKIILFLLHWLLFRLMFFSGVVKLTSRDPNWINIAAMNYHYYTQPLPSPCSHFMHNLPGFVHRAETLGTLFIETLLPFFLLIYFPLLRLLAVILIVFLNVTISITGNYGFFNFLAIALTLPILDDSFWLGKVYLFSFKIPAFQIPTLCWSMLLELPILLLVMAFSIDLLNRVFKTQLFESSAKIRKISKKLRVFHLANFYGLFGVMTTKRIELIIEGSNDGEHWLTYEFKYKPGNVYRRPPWIPGHMPRLDWQMWFCALRQYPHIPNWFLRLLERIMAGDADVLELLDLSPFPPNEPPKFLRILTFDYTFTTSEELKKTGRWWNRQSVGKFIPFSLRNSKYAPPETSE